MFAWYRDESHFGIRLHDAQTDVAGSIFVIVARFGNERVVGSVAQANTIRIRKAERRDGCVKATQRNGETQQLP